MKYFVINDTSFDRHHGCTTVMDNIHSALTDYGHVCAGTLGLGLGVKELRKKKAFSKADFVVINGEGSLHHDSVNAQQILDILLFIKNSKKVFLINATWQENQDSRWSTALSYCSAIYVRDSRSRQQLQPLYPDVNYAPDLTFLKQVVYNARDQREFLIVDSVKKSWSKVALKFCKENQEFDYITMFDGRVKKTQKKWALFRKLRHAVFTLLANHTSMSVGFDYENNQYAILATASYRERLQEYKAVYTGRYHSLCFCVQQEIPFLYAPSNTFKCEALLEDIGVDPKNYRHTLTDKEALLDSFNEMQQHYQNDEQCFKAFNLKAQALCREMFQDIHKQLNDK